MQASFLMNCPEEQTAQYNPELASGLVTYPLSLSQTHSVAPMV